MGLGGQLCHKKYLGMDAMSSKSQLLEETSRHILKKELSRFQQRRKLKRRSANCTHKSNYQRIKIDLLKRLWGAYYMNVCTEEQLDCGFS